MYKKLKFHDFLLRNVPSQTGRIFLACPWSLPEKLSRDPNFLQTFCIASSSRCEKNCQMAGCLFVVFILTIELFCYILFIYILISLGCINLSVINILKKLEKYFVRKCFIPWFKKYLSPHTFYF